VLIEQADGAAGASGTEVATHDVRLDAADWQFEAFTDLPLYLRWHAAPDRRASDDARIVGEVGTWIGSRVLGGIGPALLRRRPAVVRVEVPAGAEELLLRPLELAHVDGKPLAVQDVTLVLSSRVDTIRLASAGARLRVLGLFSLPEGKRSLNLRRERYELIRLIEGIAATGKAADVRVLQYGVTRGALHDVLADGEGWDIVHISGHGRPGELLLETAEGATDLVDGPDLAELLDAGRGRIRLVTLSACWSAAVAAGDQRRLLGLPEAHDSRFDDGSRADAGTAAASGTLATLLASRLGCAVLAMRYPVGDEFAMALTGRLYELLVDTGQPLPRAVGMTLRELGTASSSSGSTLSAGRVFPALSVATPALFGGMATDLQLAAPSGSGPAAYDTGPPKTAGFPEQELRFIGRTGVMARASAALAARSGVPGVLLHGMPGGGKTACAVELAYGHEHAFDRLVWYKAPDEGIAIHGSLADFALTVERYLPGFQMAHELVTSDRLAAFLPRLTDLMERHRVLIVIDNAESVLSESGSCQDEQWGLVLDALTAHTGLGRVVLTSRRVPATGLTRLRVESVDALSADEALLLIRELPHLQALGQGKIPGVDRLVARQLARRALEVAQGHPKLLELADSQAAKPERLAALLEAGDQAWRELGGLPAGFFSDGESAASSGDYLPILAAWTKSVTDTLAPAERDLFWFLCCLEEADRIRPVLTSSWEDLQHRLGRTGEPPDLDQALAAIAIQSLATIPPDADESHKPYTVHPAVAAAGRAFCGTPFQDAVDTGTAAFWDSLFRRASGDAGGAVHTELLVWAGLSAVPYLMRQRRWDDAAYLLQGAFLREPSRANAAAMLPAIRRITGHDPYWTGVEATVLRVLDPTAAEELLRGYLADVVAAEDYRAARVTVERLADWCRSSGRLTEALALVDQQIGYTQQADLGPWTRLSNQTLRLQILNSMGQNSRVLAEAGQLRVQMDTLPAVQGTNDRSVTPWHVRETLLENGHIAAQRLGQWADALDWNAARIASKRTRRATPADIARARFNDYFPLLRLNRNSEALGVLLDCRQVFDDANDTEMLGKTLSALADTEDERGHGDTAIQLERDALRYKYLANDVNDIASSYHNLGNYLRRHARQPIPALASHLASGLVQELIGIHDDPESVRAAAIDLRACGTAATSAAKVADLCRQLGNISGTDLPGLIAKLSPDPETAEQALRELIARAQELATS